MTEQERDPPHLELERADAYSQYILHTHTEIVYVLRTALQKNCMVTLYFDMGQSFFLSSLLNVSAQGLIFDYGSHEETNRRALQAHHLVCTTSVDKVKVQFALQGLTETEYEGHRAFRAECPTTLLRLQRREYFRVSTPIANPLRCILPCHHPEYGIERLDVTLLDLSAGGMCLMVNNDQARFLARGEVLRECVLIFPNEEQVVCDLEARNAFEVTTRSGNRYTRVGCSFLNLPSASVTLIQRYITRLERERKARQSGLE